MPRTALLLTALLALPALATAADVAAGWAHSAALDAAGRVWTWGDNRCGQLGQPDAGRTAVPRPVAGELPRLVAVAAGAWHTLALDATGGVWGWGSNRWGQVGNGQVAFDAVQPTPARVLAPDGRGPLGGVTAIAAGWDHSLALLRDGTVVAWGSRDHGQLGDGLRDGDQPSPRPTAVNLLTRVTAIAAGARHSLALREDGTVVAWGSNWDGQLGTGQRGAEAHHAEPAAVLAPTGGEPLTGVVAIAAGALHSLAVTRDGRAWAWGYNGTGQLADGQRGGFWDSAGPRLNVTRPSPVVGQPGKEPLTGAASVAAGYESTYVLNADGTALSAGWSTYGETGDGHLSGNRDRCGAVATALAITWADPQPGRWRLALAYRYTDRGHAAEGVTNLECRDAFSGPPLVVGEAAVGAEAAATARRNAGFVEAGASLTYPLSAPVGRPVVLRISALRFGAHAGDDDSAADVRLQLTAETSGQTVELPIPVAGPTTMLPPLGHVATVAAGVHHALVRDRQGNLWAWGHNGYGQLGDGTVTDRAVAQPVPAFSPTGPAPLPPRLAPPAAPDEAPPAGRTTNVRDRGAIGDGIHLDQAAIQQAIDTTSQAGGGVVLVPAGTWRTGTLVLRDGVRLHLAAGAVILGSTNREHWPQTALLTARGARNVGVSGRGVFDAQGQCFGARNWRPNVFYFEDCDGLTVEGVTTRNSGSWTQHYVRCRNVVIRGVAVLSPRPGRNNDGIDICGCQNLTLEGSTVVSDDDAIVIKSQATDRPNRDLTIVGNRCLTYRGAFKLGTETRGRCERITCRDLIAHGAKAIEIYSVDGSEVSDVEVSGVRADEALCAVSIRLGARLRPSYWAKGETPQPGTLRNVRVRDVTVDLAERSFREVLLRHSIPDAEDATADPEAPNDSVISGLPGHLVEQVEVTGLTVRMPGGTAAVPDAAAIPERPDAYPAGGMFGRLPAFGLFVRHARNVTLRDLLFEPAARDARPPLAQLDTEGVTIERLVVKEPGGGR